MKHYLEYHKFYVVDADEKLVYKVGECNFHGYEAIQVHLELVAGWDYINPDYNDVQGWCTADKFIEDVQHEYINQYFLVEGMKEALEENGYRILKENEITPRLQAIIDKHNEA